MRCQSSFLDPGKLPEPMVTVSGKSNLALLGLEMWHFKTKSRMANLHLAILLTRTTKISRKNLARYLTDPRRDWLTGVSWFHNSKQTFGAIEKIKIPKFIGKAIGAA